MFILEDTFCLFLGVFLLESDAHFQFKAGPGLLASLPLLSR